MTVVITPGKADEEGGKNLCVRESSVLLSVLLSQRFCLAGRIVINVVKNHPICESLKKGLQKY